VDRDRCRGTRGGRRYPAIPVGTAKRERQKANRQQRLEEIARTSRKEKVRRRSLQIGIAVVGGLVLLFGLAYLFSDDEPVADAPITVPPTVAPTAPASTVTPTTIDPNAPTTVAPTTVAPTTTAPPVFEYGEAPCPEADGSTAKPDTFEGAPKLCIDLDKTYTADVVTNKGSFTIELNTAGSPGNVNNFVTLARYGYYDNGGCHRVILGFMFQCGRPALATDDESEAAPGYTVADELPGEGEYAVGVVAMANTGSPNSGGGQWFVITGEQGVALPPQYTIVGTVTKGLDTTVVALGNLGDPLAANGVPPLVPITITSVTITES
jgi:cyclophilin family peptidyl-prolyl cis-trans isomerase